MFNRFTKFLLVATSLTPTLLVMAVDQFATAKEFKWLSFGMQLLAISVAFVAIAAGVMTYMAWYGPRQSLKVAKAKNSDKEVLTFLLAYLVPVLSEHKYLFKDF